MLYVRSRLVMFLAMSVIGWAQDGPSVPGDGAALKGPTPPEATTGRSFPVDVAGYVSFRYFNDDAFNEHHFYRDYSASLFLSKSVGRWRFHSELNADTAPEYTAEGIPLLPERPSLSVKLDSAFVNYNWRDGLQFQGGLLFIPTYWRTHRYQSTTLTVDEPLIDQTVFPTALRGGALYGEKFWGDGGVSYIVYAGIDQQAQFIEGTQSILNEQARVAGGKLTVHLPTRQFLTTFDIAIHRLQRITSDGLPDELYAAELHLGKNRLEVLGEFEHASLDLVHGVRTFMRQGYYVQPSWRLNPRLFAVARYDRLDRDSRYADQSSLTRQSMGLTFHPIPAISLKIEADRYEPEGGLIPAYYGVTAAAVWFFHRP
jgi:hypothetical protein